jgi:hypothetical protein
MCGGAQCALLESNLGDDFRLTLDQLGNIIGVDYRTATAECGATPADATVRNDWRPIIDGTFLSTS